MYRILSNICYQLYTKFAVYSVATQEIFIRFLYKLCVNVIRNSNSMRTINQLIINLFDFILNANYK